MNENKKDIKNLISFMDMIQNFNEVRREIFCPKTERLENDVEHSYRLAMFCWYLSENFYPESNLDINKILKYCLVHDLPEVFTGDVSTFNEAARVGKDERELAAKAKLKETYTNIEYILNLIDAYEAKNDPESRFVYAMDKLLGPTTNLLEGGKSLELRHPELTAQGFLDNKHKKIKGSAEAEDLFNLLLPELKSQGFFKWNNTSL